MAANDAKCFKLRTQIICHSTDVRCLASFSKGFVTGSRDAKAKLFLPHEPESTGFREVLAFSGAAHFVASVCVYEPEDAKSALIYIGSNDANIYCYSAQSHEPVATLMGHSGTVCALSSNEQGLVLSGSWDQTCHLWKDHKSVLVLTDHAAAVWATAFIGNQALTGSADKSIKLWDSAGTCLKKFEGHTDCVRGLLVISSDVFLSCSNDATIRKWNLKGEKLGVFYGHDNFVYSLALLSKGADGSAEYITSSEDRTVRVWRKDAVAQTIRLPATTLWSVIALSNGDIAIGASNGKVYIYTTNPELEASEEEQKALEEEVSKTALPMQELGDIKVDQLPGKEVLFAPGKKEGEMKLIKEGDGVLAYQWDSIKMEWIKIGDVVGASNATKDPSQKTEFEGKDYDYVFSVDIDEGAPPLKLPYNVGENPWKCAQDFIYKHELDQSYLDTVANFIQKNTQGMTLTQTDSTAYDPFTGSSRYVPGSAPKASKTTPSRELEEVPNQKKASSYFPINEYLMFESVNIEGLAKKLKEFSEKVPPEVSITSEDLTILLGLADLTQDITVQQISLLKLLISWPKDLLRIALLLPKVNEELASSKDSARLVDTLLVCATDSSSSPNQMLALRALSNLFQHVMGEALAVTYSSTILKAVAMCGDTAVKNIQIALATLYINFSIFLRKEAAANRRDASFKFDALAGITSTLREHIDAEAQFRLLVALGNLVTIYPDLALLAKSEDVMRLLQNLSHNNNMDKVRLCAEGVRDFLK